MSADSSNDPIDVDFKRDRLRISAEEELKKIACSRFTSVAESWWTTTLLGTCDYPRHLRLAGGRLEIGGGIGV